MTNSQGIVTKNNNIYLDFGADAAYLTGRSLAMSYSVPLSSASSPVWTVEWPNKSGGEAAWEQFLSITATVKVFIFPAGAIAKQLIMLAGRKQKVFW